MNLALLENSMNIKYVATIGKTQTTIRALIFALGHFTIDIIVISLVTEADTSKAATAAFLSPIFNAAWYWILDYTWTHINKQSRD